MTDITTRFRATPLPDDPARAVISVDGIPGTVGVLHAAVAEQIVRLANERMDWYDERKMGLRKEE